MMHRFLSMSLISHSLSPFCSLTPCVLHLVEPEELVSPHGFYTSQSSLTLPWTLFLMQISPHVLLLSQGFLPDHCSILHISPFPALYPHHPTGKIQIVLDSLFSVWSRYLAWCLRWPHLILQYLGLIPIFATRLQLAASADGGSH